MTNWKIPPADIWLDDAEVRAATDVLRSRWLTMGPRTKEFEDAFAQHHRVPHAIAVSSGTAALHLAFAALDLRDGDEVILPAMTFVATANAAVVCGARPVFADVIRLDEPTIDPDHVATLVSPRTRAIVAVHYGGYPAKVDVLAAFAQEHGIALIEDCAHAPGVLYRGRYLGDWGLVGCFSLFSNKNITTGEGGVITTRDPKLAERFGLLRSHGMTSGTWRRHHERPADYDVVEPGWNYRIDEVRSAIGLVQLGRLSDVNERRRQIAGIYHQHLAGISQARAAFNGNENAPATAAHLLPLLVADAGIRARVVASLARSGVQTSHHYPPLHLFRYYRQRYGYQSGTLPRTEDFASREITLPLYPTLCEQDIQFVCDSIRDAVLGPPR